MDDQDTAGVQFINEYGPEDEPNALNPAQVAQVVLTSADWTVETIVNQLVQGNIDLNPRFQRRDAWNRQKKSRLIESLLVGLPIPEIILAEKRSSRGKFLVLDGKQRLLTILQFTGNAQTTSNNFSLTGLEIRHDLNGFTLQKMQGNFLYQEEITSFFNQTIRTVVLRHWSDPAFLHMLFLRLNTGSVPLSPQELRQALFPGEFVNYVDERSARSAELRQLMRLTEPDFRMRDVELLVRFLGFSFFIDMYYGDLSGFLDLTCLRLNTDWQTEADAIEERVKQFEAALRNASDIFGTDNVARKWTPAGFERRLNRAVLDVIAFYFSQSEIREASRKHAPEVLSAFQRLCLESDEFRTSIESTTKSLSATYNRFRLWGEALSQAIRLDFKLPKWDQARNRIYYTGVTNVP